MDVGLRESLLSAALRIRMVEERVVALYPTDRIQSPVHLCIGHEALAVGACHALRPADILFATYRSHGFYLAKGGDLGRLFAELFGRRDGCARGKGGSMHLAAPEVGFMGTSAIVASTIPHAVGAALAAERLAKDQVVVAAFGDGATEEGVYHESLNFAALHRLPVLFLCDNNGLAVHSSLASRQAYRIADHARAYGIPVVRCPDGQDPLAVYRTAAAAVDAIRRDHAPRFVEVVTYRYREHVGPGEDYDAGYRTRDSREAWAVTDPLITEQELLARHRPRIQAEIDEAVRFAEASPPPDAADLWADVL
jgi:TPP-dependent pyruvate/acetoin dehydrogenase alpha subunit